MNTARLSTRQAGVQEPGGPTLTSSGDSVVHSEPRDKNFSPSEKVNFPGDCNLLAINDKNSLHEEERFFAENCKYG